MHFKLLMGYSKDFSRMMTASQGQNLNTSASTNNKNLTISIDKTARKAHPGARESKKQRGPGNQQGAERGPLCTLISMLFLPLKPILGILKSILRFLNAVFALIYA